MGHLLVGLIRAVMEWLSDSKVKDGYALLCFCVNFFVATAEERTKSV